MKIIQIKYGLYCKLIYICNMFNFITRENLKMKSYGK